MKNSKVKGLLGLLVLLFAVGLFGFFGYDTMDDIKLGLDLAGGVSITYQAVDENPTSEEMSDTIYKLQQRVQNYSTEAVVYQEGSDRINIDIPGVSDANAILEELGKPGSLIFTDETGKTILTGDQVASAKAGIIEQNGQKSYVVSLTFTEEGTKAFADATSANVGKRIAIIMAVVLVLFACAAAAAVWFVRSPQATIKDKENGDKVDVSSLLNSGTRIDDVFTFVVGAVDEDETRTDALMVATMDTKDKTINVMNIPRDTMCNNTATGASKKINAAYGMDTGGKGGNIEQTSKEIERLMGFRPDKYVIVNFDGIAAIVDAIGGVDYDVPFDMKYDDPSQNLHIDLKKGQQHLDGKQTVGFLRWRHNNDYTVQYTNGDEGRVENQQKFLKSLAGQVLQIKNVTKIRSIAEAVFKNVKTDFSAGELLWMGMQAMQIDNSSIQFFTLPGYGKMSTAGTSVQYSFFFPYYDQTLELVNKYFNPYEEPISKLDIVGGPDTTTYSGGYVSSGEEDNVWGDTSGSYDYSEDYYEEPDYSYDEPSYDNSGSDGDYSDNNDYSGGDSGGDYSGGDSGEESGGDSSGGDYTGGGEDSGASSGGDDGGTYDPEA